MALKRRFKKIILLLVIVAATFSFCGAKKSKSHVVTDINDYKDFKKLLKAKSNILVLFVNEAKPSQSAIAVVKKSAESLIGQATLCKLECNSSEQKKLCKKLKADPEKPFNIKHYRNGEYHKDYDRTMSVSSMIKFLRDPTGDLPWDEDPTAKAIVHLSNEEALKKFLTKTAATNKRCMIMFYAPWCGYCKILKPDYLAAATELKGHSVFGAIDASKPENSKLRTDYNVSGFPTLLFFEKGAFKYPYNGDNKKQAIIDFMKNPSPTVQPTQKPKVEESWEPSEVLQLTAENFNTKLAKIEKTLVIFYAPWCGLCKQLKPDLERAAAMIKKDKKLNGWAIGAVDATKHTELAKKYSISGYPTFKYFTSGRLNFDVGSLKNLDQIINFLLDPMPVGPEEDWSEEESSVRHLDASDFKTRLQYKQHALVAFYAPWCRHCKNMKNDFMAAAEYFTDELLVLFGAVNCVANHDLCRSNGINGYPTFKYYSFYDKTVLDYTGGHKAADFISFIHTQAGGNLPSLMNVQKTASDESSFGPNVIISTDRDFENLIAKPNPSFVMFFASWCSACTIVKPQYRKLADALKEEDSSVAIMAVDAFENSKVADLVQVTTLPVFKIYKAGKLLADYAGETSFASLLKFCHQYGGKVKTEL